MDMLFVVKQRMRELGLEQKDLAAAAKVTESYISQLLTRKKAPPAPERTDIYSKLEKSLRLPSGRLSKLAELQRKEEIKRRLLDPPAPLHKEVRNLVLRKCNPEKVEQIRTIFEKQPFGEIERLVTQKLLDVVKTVAKEELDNENWLHLFARVRQRSYEEVRVGILEFLDTDVFHISDENCVAFLEPLIESWDIDLATFGIEVVLNRRLGPAVPKRFEFVERDSTETVENAGLKEFLDDHSLSGDVTEEEIEFLKTLRFDGRRPTAMYFYRAVQSLRDPLHFRNRPAERPGPSRPKRRAKPKSRK
jgi:transcriptional regulator with XRE-family HTH domain